MELMLHTRQFTLKCVRMYRGHTSLSSTEVLVRDYQYHLIVLLSALINPLAAHLKISIQLAKKPYISTSMMLSGKSRKKSNQSFGISCRITTMHDILLYKACSKVDACTHDVQLVQILFTISGSPVENERGFRVARILSENPTELPLVRLTQTEYRHQQPDFFLRWYHGRRERVIRWG